MRGRLARSVLWSGKFHHVVYASAGRDADLLLIFIAGDGTPWTKGGTVVARDPTAHRPLALNLAVRTHFGSVVYLGRPCYLGLARSAECRPEDWTSARYSAAIVESLLTIANRLIQEHHARQVVLVGYSGGGTLAVLMAPHVANLRAVITIGADLDVAAWTHLHGYLPLSGSLDPAETRALPPSVMQIHFVGARDTNVPPALSARYFARHPRAHLRIIARFDHRCCWVRAWSGLLANALHAADVTADEFPSAGGESRRPRP
ncbi:MAG: alpha/beta fold hydrolase [Steroidobacteraceae bacterium]